MCEVSAGAKTGKIQHLILRLQSLFQRILSVRKAPLSLCAEERIWSTWCRQEPGTDAYCHLHSGQNKKETSLYILQSFEV